jgi:hypothetical protein
MYTNIVTFVSACDSESDAFPIKIGLHQGLVLSPYIFTLVMNEITKDIFLGVYSLLTMWC